MSLEKHFLKMSDYQRAAMTKVEMGIISQLTQINEDISIFRSTTV